MENIQKEIEQIKERNKSVEADKAWEVSFARKFLISIFTYIIALVWLWMIEENKFALKALVPVAGYILSTLTIPPLKKAWVNHNFN